MGRFVLNLVLQYQKGCCETYSTESRHNNRTSARTNVHLEGRRNRYHQTTLVSQTGRTAGLTVVIFSRGYYN